MNDEELKSTWIKDWGGAFATGSILIGMFLANAIDLVPKIASPNKVLIYSIVVALGVVASQFLISRLARITLKSQLRSLLETSLVDLQTTASDLKNFSLTAQHDITQLDAVSLTVKRTTGELKAVADGLTKQDWYFPAPRYADHEKAIVLDGTNVKIYIISKDLVFETKEIFLPIVQENLGRGVDYIYVTTTGNQNIKDGILSTLAPARNSCEGDCGSIKFIEIERDDPIFAYDYAAFDYTTTARDANNNKTKRRVRTMEIYMALDNEVDPSDVPWMKLRGKAHEYVWQFLYRLTNEE